MQEGIVQILLIEDDPDDAEMTIHTLKRSNVLNHCTHIDEGERALEFLYSDAHMAPTLILLDLKMPKVDGIQILRKLKSDPGRAHIPVVALLSSREGKSYVESFHLKADAYIIKPVDVQKFFSACADIGLTLQIINTPVQ